MIALIAYIVVASAGTVVAALALDRVVFETRIAIAAVAPAVAPVVVRYGSHRENK